MAHKLHTFLNSHMNEEMLPLPYSYDTEKDNIVYHLCGGGYKEEFVLHMSSVNYNRLPEYNYNTKSEYIKLCIIQYKSDITLIL